MLRQRIFTALIALAVLGIVLFVVPPTVARVVIAILILAGAFEWGGFIGAGSAAARWGFVALNGAAIAALVWGPAIPLDIVLKVALGGWLAALIWMFFFPTPVPGWLVWVAGLLVLVPAWASLDTLYLVRPELLLFALLIVWVADIGAYFLGKGFGRVKLAPAISPGKTWEGVLGGLSAVFLLAVVGSRYFEVEIAVLVPFCLAVAMLSVVGDLTVSMFKRTAGVKDSGTLFPGHGGVLDRIDSVAAASPLFVLGLPWIGLS